MVGGILIALVLVVLIPVAVMMSGALVAAALGWSLREDAEQRYAGNELIALNR